MSPYPVLRLMVGDAPPLDATGEVPETDVTTPPPDPAAEIVIPPALFVMVTFDPAVNVANE